MDTLRSGESESIDDYYDALLVDGIPMEQAIAIEQQRDAAHAKRKQRIIEEALGAAYWQNIGPI